MTKLLIRAKCKKIPSISPEKMIEWIPIKQGAKLFFLTEDWIRSQIASGRLRSFKTKNKRFIHAPSLKILAADSGRSLKRKKKKGRLS